MSEADKVDSMGRIWESAGREQHVRIVTEKPHILNTADERAAMLLDQIRGALIAICVALGVLIGFVGRIAGVW